MLNKIGAVICTACLTMKFFTDKGEIATVRADQAVARHYYNMSLEIQIRRKEEIGTPTRPPGSFNVMMVDLIILGLQETKKT